MIIQTMKSVLKHLLSSLVLISLLAACGGTPTPTSAPATATPVPASATATVTSLPSPTPSPQPIQLREFPERYPPRDALPLEECPFATRVDIENVIGTLLESPTTTVTFQPPYYENRASIRCEARSEDNALYLDLWFAPNAEVAQKDFDEVRNLIGREAISVSGLGEESLWWQRGLRLETISGDTRLTVALTSHVPDAAQQTALLAAQAMQVIQPASGLAQPETVSLPIGAPEPTSVQLRKLAAEGEFFEACSLLSQEEYEATLGPLDYPLVSGSSIGELEPFETHDCVTDALEGGGWLYYGIVFGDTPGDMILTYKRGAAAYPVNATRMDTLGDEAWYWYSPDGTNLNLSVLRGNVMLVINVLMADSYESRGQLRTLARLILERLVERSQP